jgi:hypothetical protein
MLSPGFTAANAQEAPAASTMAWQRIVHPGGKFSVELPCAETEIEERTEGGSVAISCPTDDFVFGAIHTSDGLEAEGSEGSDFDRMLSEAKNDPEVGRVETIELAGRRAFRVWSTASEPFSLAQIVERGPSDVVVVAAMMDPDGPHDSIDREAAEKVAFRYLESLEFSGQ